MKKIISVAAFAFLLISCNKDKGYDKKGFQVNEILESESGEKIIGLPIDSLDFETKPKGVILTKHDAHRLIPIYKVNYNRKTKETYVGSNSFHYSWSSERYEGDNWNNHFIPGFSIVSGYNMVNIAHFDFGNKKQNNFFEKPILVWNLYFPAFSNDTLNGQPVIRDFYMVSVYDEDTNKDGFINIKDARRLYFFDINAVQKTALVPLNYSVLSSEFDSANDFMYVYAKLDKNGNGVAENEEPITIFWIDLKNPTNKGILYEKK